MTFGNQRSDSSVSRMADCLIRMNLHLLLVYTSGILTAVIHLILTISMVKSFSIFCGAAYNYIIINQAQSIDLGKL